MYLLLSCEYLHPFRLCCDYPCYGNLGLCHPFDIFIPSDNESSLRWSFPPCSATSLNQHGSPPFHPIDSDTQDRSLTEARTADPSTLALLSSRTCSVDLSDVCTAPLPRPLTSYTFCHLASTLLTDLVDFFIIHGLRTLLLIQKMAQKHPFTFACSFIFAYLNLILHPTFTISLTSNPSSTPFPVSYSAPLFPLTS